MSDVTVTAASVRPGPGAMIQRFEAGGSVNVGDAVYVSAVTDIGEVQQANGSAVATSWPFGGVVVATTAAGGTLAADGDQVDVVVYGPVHGFSSLAAGLHYVSDTPGKIGTAAGTKDLVVGYAKSADTLFVQPQIIDFS